jgi:maleylacetoacetate isomerase
MKLFSFWRSLATFRVRIALNMKGLAPEVVDVDLIKGQQRNPEFRAVNPQMLIPALIDDDGRMLFQSIAILEYLDETHPNPPLLPKDPFDRARVRGLALIVAADAHPLVVPRIRNYLEHELKLDEPTRLKWIRNWSNEALTALEAHLSRDKQTGRYCHGDQVTMADI